MTCALRVFVVRCQSVIRVTEALEAATVIANDVYILNELTAHSIFIVIYSFIVLQLDIVTVSSGILWHLFITG